MRLQSHEVKTGLPSHVPVAEYAYPYAFVTTSQSTTNTSIFCFRICLVICLVLNLVVTVAPVFLVQCGSALRLQRFLVRTPTNSILRSWIRTTLVWHVNSSNNYSTFFLVPSYIKDLR
ncbi:unnamed protein product [Schistosoma curassoni]|uniref:Uncharacterized protein n=1 Tax=Schistosoma curassoni TaxID=6186 RepID=A0A183L0S3_9TREM|nr:unnamed protein product [Schistosoma curassoni]